MTGSSQKPDVSDSQERNGRSTATKLADGFAQSDSLDVVRTQRQTVASDSTGLQPLEIGDFGGITPQDNTQAKVLTYPDGKQRTLSVQPDGSISAFTDTDGNLYRRNAQGQWLGPDGKSTEWQGVSESNGTFSIQKKDGSIDAFDKNNKKTHLWGSETRDARLYPPESEIAQEEQRIRNLIIRDGGLSANGRIVQEDALQLGATMTDLWHGREIKVSGGDGTVGDGGALYEKWSKMPGIEKRTSSHYNDVLIDGKKPQQYQLDLGPGNGVVLFGRTAEGDTWFQFERNAGRSGVDLGEETKNFVGNLIGGRTDPWRDGHNRDGDVSAALGGQSVGPYGFNDRPPLVVGQAKYVGNPQNA